MIKKFVKLSLVGFLFSLIFLVACQFQHQQVRESYSATPIPNFTYTSYDGAIWQVNVDGHKTQILPDDNIEKKLLKWSPDRQWLAYVTREWPERNGIQQPVQEKLKVLKANDITVQQLAGPVAAIYFEWVVDNTIKLLTTNKLSDGSERQQWDVFLVNVETGESTQVEQLEEMSLNTSSPNNQWSFEIEEKDDIRQAYLLDQQGKRVDIIFERPANQRWYLRWAPSSRYLFYHSYFKDNVDIYLYDLSTQESENITRFAKNHEGYLSILSVSWSPTSEWILVNRSTDKRYGEPCLIAIPQGNVHCFDISPVANNDFVWSLDGSYLGLVGPSGDNPRDVYAINAITNKLLNLTQDGNEIREVEIEP